MSYSYVATHVIEGVELLSEQYRDRPNMAAFVTAWMNRVQELEDALPALAALLDPDLLSGVQLDELGAIIGQPREGLDDDDYRLWLKGRIAASNSSGRPEDIYAVARQLLDTPSTPAGLHLFDSHGAPGFVLELSTTTAQSVEQVARLLRQAKPAGVPFWLVYPVLGPSEELFRFSASTAIETSSPYGFDTGKLAGVTTGAT